MTPLEELLKKTEGELTTRREEELDALLPTSKELQAEQRRVDQLINAVSRPAPELASIDLREGLWAKPVAPRQQNVNRWPVIAVALSIAATLILMIAWPGSGDDQFRTKGSAAGEFSGFDAFVVRNGITEPIGTSIARDEALGFVYRNQPESRNRALLIYAIDSTGEIFWFYPEWQNVQAPPSSIAITTSSLPIELPYATKHHFAPGKLTLNAVFTERPLSVLEIEGGRVLPAAQISVEVRQ